MTLRLIQRRDRGQQGADNGSGTHLELPAGAHEAAFVSAGTVCRGWQFVPQQEPARATLVMAHGLGGTIDGGLIDFARRLSRSGIRVVGFDYRYFGRSNGKPRQLITVDNQLTDWSAAIAFAQRLDPPAPLVLWGTSFSSGHVMHIAARRHDIAAVIAQNPMLDGRASVLATLRRDGLKPTLRLALSAIEDSLRGLAGIDPLRLPIVAEPGGHAALTAPGAVDGVLSFAEPNFDNSMSARVLLTLSLYRPLKRAGRIRCPVLLQLCLRDTVTPIAPGYRAAAKLGARAVVKTYDCGHFDIYQGQAHEALVADQLAFLDQLLGRE